MSTVFTKLTFGPLPVELIEVTLGIELEPGNAVMSVGAQVHASRKHPHEYWVCQPHVAWVVANPLYLGDDLRNAGKIELVGRPPGLGAALLVAVTLELDGDGNYNVLSFYTIKDEKVDNRRAKNHLKVARRK